MGPIPAADPVDRFYAVVRFIGRFWVWFFFKHVDVRRPEQLPPRGPVLLCINHPNNLIDSLLVGAVLTRKVHYLATAALFRNPLLAIVLAVGSAHALLWPARVAAQPSTIRVQYIVPVDQVISLFDVPKIQQTVLKNYGKRYKMELGRAQGTPFLVAAMAAGEADVTFLAYNSFASAVIKNVVPGGLTIVGSDF